MELKLSDRGDFPDIVSVLLIVPYGIETDKCNFLA